MRAIFPLFGMVLTLFFFGCASTRINSHIPQTEPYKNYSVYGKAELGTDPKGRIFLKDPALAGIVEPGDWVISYREEDTTTRLDGLFQVLAHYLDGMELALIFENPKTSSETPVQFNRVEDFTEVDLLSESPLGQITATEPLTFEPFVEKYDPELLSSDACYYLARPDGETPFSETRTFGVTRWAYGVVTANEQDPKQLTIVDSFLDPEEEDLVIPCSDLKLTTFYPSYLRGVILKPTDFSKTSQQELTEKLGTITTDIVDQRPGWLNTYLKNTTDVYSWEDLDKSLPLSVSKLDVLRISDAHDADLLIWPVDNGQGEDGVFDFAVAVANDQKFPIIIGQLNTFFGYPMLLDAALQLPDVDTSEPKDLFHLIWAMRSLQGRFHPASLFTLERLTDQGLKLSGSDVVLWRRLAELYTLSGRYYTGLKILSTLEESAPKHRRKAAKADTNLYRGRLEIIQSLIHNSGNIDKHFQNFSKTADAYKALKLPFPEGWVHEVWGNVLYGVRGLDEAMVHWKKAIALYEEGKVYRRAVRLQLHVASLVWTDPWERAESVVWYEEALKNAKLTEDDYIALLATLELAWTSSGNDLARSQGYLDDVNILLTRLKSKRTQIRRDIYKQFMLGHQGKAQISELEEPIKALLEGQNYEEAYERILALTYIYFNTGSWENYAARASQLANTRQSPSRPKSPEFIDKAMRTGIFLCTRPLTREAWSALGDKALNFSRTVAGILELQGKTNEAFELFVKVSGILFRQNNYQKALELSNYAEGYYQSYELNLPVVLGQNYLQKGQSKSKLDDDTALKDYESAIHTLTETDEITLIRDVYWTYAQQTLKTDRKEKAVHILRRFQSTFSRDESTPRLAKSFLILGDFYAERKDTKKSLEFYNTALSHFRRQGNMAGVSHCLFKKGSLKKTN